MSAGPTALFDALKDRYALERELGRGGMATVYLARDLRYDRLVALKVLHGELAQSLGPERFQREIMFAARLQHPHILTVLDSGDAAGQLWFTMPFVEGESLRDRLNKEQQLPIHDALQIVREAAVRPIETTAKIMNWTTRLLMPIKPASAAASAPMPNQSSTNPEVKISATMSIAPSTLHKIQSQSAIFRVHP
jgi:hypothetical protein